jgi:hypothetical protein
MESFYVYFYRIIACVKMSYIELESTWIHDYPGASNDMSISKKVDCSCSSGKTC